MDSQREERARSLVSVELKKQAAEIEKAEDAEAKAEAAYGSHRLRLLHAARLHRSAAALHERAARLHQLHANHEHENHPAEGQDDDAGDAAT